jgi:hypothetical protein
MHEFHRHVLGICRIRPAPKREQAPTGLEPLGHGGGELRQTKSLALEKLLRDTIPLQETVCHARR